MILSSDPQAYIKSTLRNGRSLKIRAYGCSDQPKLSEFLLRLSGQSKYLRFGYEKSVFSQREIEELAFCNYPDDFALVGVRGQGKRERIVALGTWSLIPGTSVAEVGFVVEDAIQLRGVGTELLKYLAEEATAAGIKQFLAYVLLENSRMLDVFESSGYNLSKKFCDGSYEIRIDITDREEFLRRDVQRRQVSSRALLMRFLCPGGVVVIGDLDNPDSAASEILRSLRVGGFTGQIFTAPVSPLSGEDLLFASRLEGVPDTSGLAIVAVPLDKVLEIMPVLIEKGMTAFLALYHGETCVEKDRWRGDIAQLALAYGVRLLGLGSLGIINAGESHCLNTIAGGFLASPARLGIAADDPIISRSLLDHLRREKQGVKHFICLGDQSDVTIGEVLEFWEAEEDVQVILLALKSIEKHVHFARIVKRVSRSKPVILYGEELAAGGTGRSLEDGSEGYYGGLLPVPSVGAGLTIVPGIEDMFNKADILLRKFPSDPAAQTS